jgi:hypothetical protein
MGTIHSTQIVLDGVERGSEVYDAVNFKILLLF